MPPVSPPRGSESERLRAPGDAPPPSFGTFDGAPRLASGGGGGGGDKGGGDKGGSGGDDDEDAYSYFETDASPLDANTDAELEVEIVRRTQRRGARGAARRGARVRAENGERAFSARAARARACVRKNTPLTRAPPR
jgi:hypothetical protein